jgi:hypothetical protein
VVGGPTGDSDSEQMTVKQTRLEVNTADAKTVSMSYKRHSKDKDKMTGEQTYFICTAFCTHIINACPV